MLRREEVLRDHAVEEGEQRRVVAGDLEQAARLVVEAEQAGGPELEELLEGPEAARKGDEGVGELGEPRLALVHRADHLQPRQPAVADLVLVEEAGDDADHLATRLEAGVGDHLHQADVATAVDEPRAAARDRSTAAPTSSRSARSSIAR